jgi:hypothetical protein
MLVISWSRGMAQAQWYFRYLRENCDLLVVGLEVLGARDLVMG